MKPKHTPGPWRVGDAGHAVFGPKDSGMHPNAPITVVQRIVNPANARLIAAAPELLEALNALKTKVLASGNASAFFPELEQAIRAIAKAAGGTE